MSASTIVLLLAKVTLTTAMGLAAASLARRRRAAVRHVLLAATFAIAIVLPLASIVAPSISITLPMASTPVSSKPLDAPAGVTTDVMPLPAVAPGAPTTAAPAKSTVSISSMLSGLWIAGAAVFLLPIAVGLSQMRSLRRTGRPWPHAQALVDGVARDAGIRRHVSALLHDRTHGPLTFGLIRPVVVLPSAAVEWPADDLRRAVIHEVEHVRRADWMTLCLSRMACAAYWCHPLVWAAWHRCTLEAERACDDAVLRRSEATAYADQLVGLARQLSTAARQPLLAMANRADLSKRVVAVLDDHQPRGRAGAPWVAAAVLASLAMLVAVSPLQLIAAVQTPQTTTSGSARQRYDVASVKPCVAEAQPTGARGTYGGTNASFSPGRFTVPCVTAGQLIYLAYAAAGVDPTDRLINDDPGMAASAVKVRGGPDWVHSLRDKYTVEATAAGATERTSLMGAMLRTLLEDRFKLQLHRDTEEVDMYALTVARGGLKIKPMKDDDCEPNPNDGSPVDLTAAKPRCGNLSMLSAAGRTRWTFGGTTFDSLAATLGRTLGAHVIDRTGIKDRFIVRLEFQRDGQQAGEVRDPATGRDVTLPEAPPLATAVEEQLGLKLEKTKGPRGYLVIDHIERPTPNAPAAPPPARAAGAGSR